jgi:hypothetical protein
MRNRRSFWLALCCCFVLALSCESASAGETETRVSVPGGAYTNLWHLDEGMIGWTRQGYPLIYGQGR